MRIKRKKKKFRKEQTNMQRQNKYEKNAQQKGK